MTAPKGSKQLVSNPEFSVSDQILQGKLNDGKNDNYVSPGEMVIRLRIRGSAPQAVFAWKMCWIR
ncbi:hypothetical protein ACKZDW_04975 (plasmid) [Ralstonia syzygii subsp. celebesensis]